MTITREMEEAQSVKMLGDRIGYGRMMHLAEELWRENLRGYGVGGGELVVGPCAAFTIPCGCDDPAHCEWCCGCGWLIRHVRELKDSLT